MYERLFDAEYRAYCLDCVARARLMLREKQDITAAAFHAARTPLPYKEWVIQQDPAQRYDPLDMERRKEEFKQRSSARKQAVEFEAIRRRNLS